MRFFIGIISEDKAVFFKGSHPTLGMSHDVVLAVSPVVLAID